MTWLVNAVTTNVNSWWAKLHFQYGQLAVAKLMLQSDMP